MNPRVRQGKVSLKKRQKGRETLEGSVFQNNEELRYVIQKYSGESQVF